MGNSITQSIKEQQEKNELEVTETLQMMHKMMENRIAAASSRVCAKLNGYHRSIKTRQLEGREFDSHMELGIFSELAGV